MKDKEIENTIASIKDVLDTTEIDLALTLICNIIYENFKNYDWVGFYWVHPEKEKVLYLRAYKGEPTEHVEIPFGVGICGQVAESQETMIVRDVSTAKNYLSCSFKVKSEIVIPIMKNGLFIGQLDIDSHQLNAFLDKDKMMLEKICRLISQKI